MVFYMEKLHPGLFARTKDENDFGLLRKLREFQREKLLTF